MIGIQYACLFTKNGVSTNTLRPHRARSTAVEEAVALAVAEEQPEAMVRGALVEPAGIHRWTVPSPVDQVARCAVQIVKIAGSDDPTTVVGAANAAVERPAEPELSVESQNTLVRNGLD